MFARGFSLVGYVYYVSKRFFSPSHRYVSELASLRVRSISAVLALFAYLKRRFARSPILRCLRAL